MNNELRILIGVPGSGKSTYANQLLKEDKSFVKASRDDFRHMLRNEWYPGEEVENLVSAAVEATIFLAFAKGFSVVLDNTHCNAKTLRDTIRKYGKRARIVLKVIGSELSLKQIKEQNLQRDKVVPEKVIDSMYKGFTNIVKNKKDFLDLIDEVSTDMVKVSTFKQNNQLPKAILVDIDGTVASHDGIRSPYDWHKVDQDRPIDEVLNIIRTLSSQYKIFFVSGRDESCRDLTTLWLDTYYSKEYELFMRPRNDYRKDNIIKKEIFFREFKDKYYIEMLFDDRQQVVDMYRKELGLKVAQVDYGDF